MARKIYLVEDIANSPGKIYAVFAREEDAYDFVDDFYPEEAKVVERTVCYGQQSAGYIE